MISGEAAGLFYLLMEHVDGVNLRQLLQQRKLSSKGHVKIADFGIAQILGRDAAEEKTRCDTAVVGTPRYMAPEQKSAPETTDNRADIYSLGVVFYEMLTGELPAEKLQPPSKSAN